MGTGRARTAALKLKRFRIVPDTSCLRSIRTGRELQPCFAPSAAANVVMCRDEEIGFFSL